jgi:hypothetical protein
MSPVQMSQIKNITFAALHKPPHFEPRYSPESVDFYLNKFMKPQTVTHLRSVASNYNNIDFNRLRVNEIENPQIRLMVKQDLINVLDDAIMETFYKNPPIEELTHPSYNLTFNEENERYVEDGPFDNEAKKRLEINLCKHINELVFKRTANTCTCWGFV